MSSQTMITVNGIKYVVTVDPKITLLHYLRDTLGLMGTKNGCNCKGHCGACTVIINNEAKRACLVKMGKLDGAIVETIESVEDRLHQTSDILNGLHPLQKAFVLEGAVQCGFCTPGMIMSALALLRKNLSPTDDEIKQALKFNFCRCTGYASIIKAIRAAANMMSSNSVFKHSHKNNKDVIRKDAVLKVIGKAVYADDIVEPNMLYGKLLLSDYPHANILSIDTSEAKKMPGVSAVLTAKDIPGRKTFGLFNPQQPVMCEDKVRYIGDSLAVVIAESYQQAEEAVKKIKVEYQPLPGVYDALDGMKSDAPKIYADGNLLNHVKVRKGDVEKAFAKADVIIEGDYYTPMIEHAYLEPESCVSKFEDDGTLLVYTGSQSSFAMRDMIAKSLNLPDEKVRVILTVTGGAFGGKEEPIMQIHCALGTMVTGRPVKMTLTREESIRMSTKRHAEYIHMKHGATKDGKVVAVLSRAICDTGAYVSVGPAVVFRSSVVAAGPYEIPNAHTDAWGIFTNNNVGGAFRGFGSTQVAFASEIQMDKLARALDIDPIEFRLKNALSVGKATITGQVLRDGVGFIETLNTVKDAVKNINKSELEKKSGKKIGLGVASSYKNVGIGTGKADGAGASVEMMNDGKILVKFGATENGQGSDSAMAIIAAEAIGVTYDDIEILSSDTKHTPDGGVTTASRQTFVTGNAVLCASNVFKEKLLKFVSNKTNEELKDLSVQKIGNLNYVIGKNSKISFDELYKESLEKGIKIESFYYYDPPETHKLRDSADHEPGLDLKEYDIHYAYCFGTQAAVVEVDETTGEVSVLKIFAAQDSGKSIYPQSVNGQIEGAVMMGVGYALSEEYRQKEGMVVTDTLNKLRVPMISKAPEIIPLVVEKSQQTGPFGAKGMGEVPVNPTAPAILNAIYDAVGVRLNKIPATKEDVLAAIEMKRKNESK